MSKDNRKLRKEVMNLTVINEKKKLENWPDIEVENFLHYLCVEGGLAGNTIMSYRRDLRRFTKFAELRGLTLPNQVTPQTAMAFVKWLSHPVEKDHAKLSEATIARHVVSLRMFMRYHKLMGHTKTDLCDLMETPRTWSRVPRVLTKEQAETLVSAIDPKDTLYLRDKALLELLYATGMRASEAASLNLNDINEKIGYLRCVGKGNKERVIPIHRYALDVLHDYIKNLRMDLTEKTNCRKLFVSKNGRELSRIEIWRIVKKAAAKAGLSGKVTPHTLRHCFGTHLLQGGADLKSVQEMLGHADASTTQIYTHVNHEHLRSLHKKYHPMG